MDPELNLAAPGAGLPFPERVLARFAFAMRRATGSRERFIAHFRTEQVRLAEVIASVTPRRRGERVLIPRLRGLEDSSRNWSLWMTLEHLRLCHEAFASVISGLVAGRVPAGQASTAAVKPSPDVGAGVEAAHEAACQRLLDVAVRAPGDLRTEATYVHPWFGALDAFGWLGLSATHLGIHRRQAGEIRHRLPRAET